MKLLKLVLACAAHSHDLLEQHHSHHDFGNASLKALGFLLLSHSPALRMQMFGHRNDASSFSRSQRSSSSVSQGRKADASMNIINGLERIEASPRAGKTRFADQGKYSRRTALNAGVGVSVALVSNVGHASAADIATASRSTLETSWIASDGFSPKSRNFIEFDESAYKSMLDDEKRTPMFVKAIEKRLASAPSGSMTVLDLGTGPDCVFALAAARAGAKKVYAIEGNLKAAKRAQKTILDAEEKKEIAPGVVELMIGLSEKIDLPEKVDFIVAEITGSVSSEEGAYASFRDAHRFTKEPSNPNSYIPYALQTFGAPATYALHYALGPPTFDWSKLKGEPVRLNCRDTTLELLADPLMVEEILPASTIPSSGLLPSTTLEWKIDSTRVTANEAVYYEELLKENATEEDARRVSREVSQTMSGIALWQRMVLDAEGTMIVPSRGPKGEPEKSHWQTVLPLLSSRPVPVQPGDSVRASFQVDLQGGKIGQPLKYSLTADINPS